MFPCEYRADAQEAELDLAALVDAGEEEDHLLAAQLQRPRRRLARLGNRTR